MRYYATASGPKVREAMRGGALGQIATPGSGHRVQPGVDWCADNSAYTGLLWNQICQVRTRLPRPGAVEEWCCDTGQVLCRLRSSSALGDHRFREVDRQQSRARRCSGAMRRWLVNKVLQPVVCFGVGVQEISLGVGQPGSGRR